MTVAKGLWLVPFCCALACLSSACGDDGPDPGTERGACYPNGTCNQGLVCLSGICVAPGMSDAGPDANAPKDAALPDANVSDAALHDAGLPDAGPPDSTFPDAAGSDGAPPDVGAPDGETPDGAAPDGSTGDGGVACTPDHLPGVRAPLDILFLVDRAASMAEGGKWTSLLNALSSFVGSDDTGGMGVGMQFYPSPPAGPIPTYCSSDPDCGLYGPCLPGMNRCAGSFALDSSCDPSDYDEPTVPIAELPGAAGAVTSALAGTNPDGSSTPLQPAFEGAAAFVEAWATAHPDRPVFLVLASDGTPTGCTYNSMAGVATLAATLFAGSPSVPTYVLGPENAGGEMDLAGLNDIAASGGTGAAVVLDASGMALEGFIDALNTVRRCQYQLPEPQLVPFQSGLVNLALVDPAVPGTSELVLHRPDASGCNAAGGWYYDDPTTPTLILLCPATCDRSELLGLDVDMLWGCPTSSQ